MSIVGDSLAVGLLLLIAEESHMLLCYTRNAMECYSMVAVYPALHWGLPLTMPRMA
jgi:hypothetical protein